MKYITPPENQGQVVEYAYALYMGDLYIRVTDTSDGHVVYYIYRDYSADYPDDDGQYVNGAPPDGIWDHMLDRKPHEHYT